MSSGYDTLASDWDQSLAYLIRLDTCCQALNAAKFEGPDYELWTKALWAFYLELSSNLYHEVRGEDKRSAQKNGVDPESLQSEQAIAEKLINKAENSLRADNISEMNTFKRFVEAEKFLRSKMRERGLLIKMKHDPGLALRNDKSY